MASWKRSTVIGPAVANLGGRGHGGGASQIGDGLPVRFTMIPMKDGGLHGAVWQGASRRSDGVNLSRRRAG